MPRDGMLVRCAVEGDVTKAREVLHSSGQRLQKSSIGHWNESYPSADVFRQNVLAQKLYIAAVPSYTVAGVLAMDAWQDVQWSQLPLCVVGTVSVVRGLTVDPGCHRWPVAGVLLQFAEGWARRSGSSAIRIEVRRENAPALRLCKALGYRQVGPLQDRQGVVSTLEKELP